MIWSDVIFLFSGAGIASDQIHVQELLKVFVSTLWRNNRQQPELYELCEMTGGLQKQRKCKRCFVYLQTPIWEGGAIRIVPPLWSGFCFIIVANKRKKNCK